MLPSGESGKQEESPLRRADLFLIALRLRLRTDLHPVEPKPGLVGEPQAFTPSSQNRARRGPRACGARNYLEIIHYRRPEGLLHPRFVLTVWSLRLRFGYFFLDLRANKW